MNNVEKIGPFLSRDLRVFVNGVEIPVLIATLCKNVSKQQTFEFDSLANPNLLELRFEVKVMVQDVELMRGTIYMVDTNVQMEDLITSRVYVETIVDKASHS